MVTVSTDTWWLLFSLVSPPSFRAGLKEREFRHPTAVFNIPPEEFPFNAGRMLPWCSRNPILSYYHTISENMIYLGILSPFSTVSLLISTPPRLCSGWLMNPCKFCLLIIRRSKILIVDVVMRREDAMGNADLCTCLFSWISNKTQPHGERTSFLATDNSLQSFCNVEEMIIFHAYFLPF